LWVTTINGTFILKGAEQMIELKPMDVVILTGTGYKWYYEPVHILIKWRTLGDAVHCITMKDNITGYSPTFKGVDKIELHSMYKGFGCNVFRYNKPVDIEQLTKWCEEKFDTNKGYDFWRQWFLGFVCGSQKRNLVNEEDKWTCSEFPYWAFQENGLKLTPREEILPMPRLFLYHNDFDCVYSGIID
jgi:hypothetical protein